MHGNSFRRSAWALTGALLVPALAGTGAHAQSTQAVGPSIERLITDGWEIAGYAALALESRSFVLFRHKDHKYLVQCSIRYDVTRRPNVVTNCYELR